MYQFALTLRGSRQNDKISYICKVLLKFGGPENNFSTPKIIKSNFSQNLMWVTPIFIAEMDSAFKITTRQ